jgi:glycosyltransferase involved in cell wall biosynthesis
VIENGVDPQRLRDEVDTLEPLPSGLVGRTFLLTVGAFVWDKGHDVLLEAFRRVASMHPNLLLVMIGRSGPALATLRSTIRELRLDDRVIMLADMPHKDLLRYYRRASLFVLPSRREAFGIVLLEAGVFALPVVATKVGGVPEALGNDECGFLVPPEDPEAMSQAILSLLGDPERAARAGRRLFTRVTTQFSWTSSCARYLQLAQI